MGREANGSSGEENSGMTPSGTRTNRLGELLESRIKSRIHTAFEHEVISGRRDCARSGITPLVFGFSADQARAFGRFLTAELTLHSCPVFTREASDIRARPL